MLFRRILWAIYLTLLFLKPGFSAVNPDETLSVDSSLGQVVAHCARGGLSSSPDSRSQGSTKGSAPGTAQHYVWLFKQWHLAPSINTKGITEIYPQTQNQTAIYLQIERWILDRKIKTIFAEGCGGAGAGQHSLQSLGQSLGFNGWKIDDLKKVSQQPGYAQIVTSVPLKLEAKYGRQLQILCGDDEALIQENNLALSDFRGTIGFLGRLSEYSADPARAEPYLEGTIEAYKMDPRTTIDQAKARLKVELKAAVERAKLDIAKRNQHLVDAIRHSSEKNEVVVFGGLHAPGIVKLLEKAGIGCTVIEPVGYRDDEEQLLAELDQAIDKIMKSP